MRPPHVAIAGDAAMASAVATALGPGFGARLTILAQDPRQLYVAPSGRDLRIARQGDAMDIADAVVFCAPPGAARETIGALIRDVGARAARACPKTVLVIATEGSLSLAQEAARTTGLDPALVLAAGGLPFAAHERARIAARHALSPSQIQLVVIGADGAGTLRTLSQYVCVNGIPDTDLGTPKARMVPAAWTGPTPATLAHAGAELARAVAQDRKEILCCGAHTGDAYGIPGGWISAPVRVGAAGALDPIPLRLTVEERSFLMSVAALPSDARAW